MKAARMSDKHVNFYQTTPCNNNPEDNHLKMIITVKRKFEKELTWKISVFAPVNYYGKFSYWYAMQLIDIVHVSQTDDLFIFMLHLWNKWKLFISGVQLLGALPYD